MYSIMHFALALYHNSLGRGLPWFYSYCRRFVSLRLASRGCWCCLVRWHAGGFFCPVLYGLAGEKPASACCIILRPGLSVFGSGLAI